MPLQGAIKLMSFFFLGGGDMGKKRLLKAGRRWVYQDFVCTNHLNLEGQLLSIQYFSYIISHRKWATWWRLVEDSAFMTCHGRSMLDEFSGRENRGGSMSYHPKTNMSPLINGWKTYNSYWSSSFSGHILIWNMNFQPFAFWFLATTVGSSPPFLAVDLFFVCFAVWPRWWCRGRRCLGSMQRVG